jgi:glyoxylase-like metal-dependent hydrolase (beta-lactamase superfamily II)
MRCLLIVEGDRRILIDCGMGNKQSEKFFSHYHPHGHHTLFSSLAEKGFQPENITDVILTHLHFDHCGGAIVLENGNLKPAFPHATFWSNENHWNWAIEPNDREKASFLKENILPLKESGQLKFITEKEGETTAFTPNIDIRFVQGHTRSMMLPQIKIGERTIVYMADLIPSASHIPLPYVMAYDMFPIKTLEEKKIFLEEAVNKNYILFFEHDHVDTCCTVEKTEKGFRKKNTVALADAGIN